VADRHCGTHTDNVTVELTASVGDMVGSNVVVDRNDEVDDARDYEAVDYSDSPELSVGTELRADPVEQPERHAPRLSHLDTFLSEDECSLDAHPR